MLYRPRRQRHCFHHPPPMGAVAAGPVTKIKLSTIIDQTVEDEIVHLPNLTVLAMHTRYRAAMDEAPDPEVACTDVQITAMDHLLTTGMPPHVDLSVWAHSAHACWGESASPD